MRQFNQIKQLEARKRNAVKRTRGTAAATEQQRRVSLAAGGTKWRITNWRQVAMGMSKWA